MNLSPLASSILTDETILRYLGSISDMNLDGRVSTVCPFLKREPANNMTHVSLARVIATYSNLLSSSIWARESMLMDDGNRSSSTPTT